MSEKSPERYESDRRREALKFTVKKIASFLYFLVSMTNLNGTKGPGFFKMIHS